MSKASGPDLRKYMEKKLSIKLNGNRNVTGVLRGFDQFMVSTAQPFGLAKLDFCA
eukprot:SAG31_NODE_1799_length_7241_cov_11.407029_6_plen_55_part_00